jgi:hypothetical protein
MGEAMRATVAVFLGVMLAYASASGQVAPSDSVTVTSEKERQVINTFVTKLSSPARLTAKLGRWDVGICPVVIGIKPEFGKFIVQRVRSTAARVGAPVNNDEGCRPNIHVVFTTAPQGLLTNIRNDQPYLLGYADSEASKDRLATVALPIQAWYALQTRDLRGKTTFDSHKVTGTGNELHIPCPECPAGYMVMPYVIGASTVTGGRLGDGRRSVFYNVIIVADPNALLDHEMGTVADHVAMLALAQMDSLKECPPLPSIMNLFTQGCAAKPTGMTVNDEGYLRGLYSMDAKAILQVQRDQMVHKIWQSIQGR